MATGSLFDSALYPSHTSTASGSMMTRPSSGNLSFLDASVDGPTQAAQLFAASAPAMAVDGSFASYHSSSHPDLQQLALLQLSSQQAQQAGLLHSPLATHTALPAQMQSASSAADSLSHAMSLSSEASSQFLLSHTPSLSFDATSSLSSLSATGLSPVHSAPLQLPPLLAPHSPESNLQQTLLHQQMLHPLFAHQPAPASNHASAAAAAVAAAAAALSATQPTLPPPNHLLPPQPFLPSTMMNTSPPSTLPCMPARLLTQPPPPPPARASRMSPEPPRRSPPPTHHQRTSSDPASDCENRDPYQQSRHKDNLVPGTDISLLDYFFNPQYSNSRSHLVR